MLLHKHSRLGCKHFWGLANSSKDATGVFYVIQIDNDEWSAQSSSMIHDDDEPFVLTVIGTENRDDSFDTRSRESPQKQKHSLLSATKKKSPNVLS